MTHKKIAELAHVSASTVSKALSGSPEISNELSEQIRKIALECGYFKEKSKNKLKKHKKRPVIAVICPEIISVFYSTIITKLKNEIEDCNGYICIYIYDFDANKMNNIIKNVILRGDCDGIITFNRPDINTPLNIPIVCLSSPNAENSQSIDTVGADYKKAIFDAIGYLKSLGHTEIGFAGELLTATCYQYFKTALKQNNLPVNEDYIYISNLRFGETGKDIADKILKSHKFPTAILAAYDEIAMSLIHEFSKNGISVPDNISIMGINDIPYASYAHIPLTTINLYPEEQYSIAVKILFNRIFDENAPIQHVTIQHKIMERETTKSYGVI